MDYRDAVFDVDGTVVRSDEVILSALDGFAAADAAGFDRLFVPNNPTKAPVAYETRLRQTGTGATTDEVVTSGTTTTAYLADQHPGTRTFVIGELGFHDQPRDVDPELVGSEDDPEVVVVAIDHEFHYDDPRDANCTLRAGAAFYGTDPDVTIPTADGGIPGSGAIINAAAGVAERNPDVALGKPSKVAQEDVLDKLGLPPEETLTVDDRLDTDVAFGLDAGMGTALARTGVTDDMVLVASEYELGHVFDDLGEVERLASEQYGSAVKAVELRRPCRGSSLHNHYRSDATTTERVIPTSRKRVLLLAGDSVEDYEIMVLSQVLQTVGHEVYAVCPEKEDGDWCKTAVRDFRGDQTYLETCGHDFTLSMTLVDIDPADYDALVAPGGRVPEYFRGYDKVLDAVRHSFDEDKPVVTICHGPQILAAAGVLNGYEMTACPAIRAETKRAGYSWVDEVTADGNFVTGQAWPGHLEWLTVFLDVLGIEISHEPTTAAVDD